MALLDFLKYGSQEKDVTLIAASPTVIDCHKKVLLSTSYELILNIKTWLLENILIDNSLHALIFIVLQNYTKFTLLLYNQKNFDIIFSFFCVFLTQINMHEIFSVSLQYFSLHLIKQFFQKCRYTVIHISFCCQTDHKCEKSQ